MNFSAVSLLGEASTGVRSIKERRQAVKSAVYAGYDIEWLEITHLKYPTWLMIGIYKPS